MFRTLATRIPAFRITGALQHPEPFPCSLVPFLSACPPFPALIYTFPECLSSFPAPKHGRLRFINRLLRKLAADVTLSAAKGLKNKILRCAHAKVIYGQTIRA